MEHFKKLILVLLILMFSTSAYAENFGVIAATFDAVMDFYE